MARDIRGIGFKAADQTAGKPEIGRQSDLRVRDKVMQNVNHHEKDVINCDIRRIVGIDELEQEVQVRFEDRHVGYDFNEMDELQPSSAVTTHKSQGSKYPVVVPIHTQHCMLLQRNLLYTAVTRGRELVVLVGMKKAIAIAVRRTESRRRVTTLKQRLVERAGAAGGTITG